MVPQLPIIYYPIIILVKINDVLLVMRLNIFIRIVTEESEKLVVRLFVRNQIIKRALRSFHRDQS